MVTHDQVMEALRSVNDPELHKSLVELDMVDKIEIKDGLVDVTIKLTIPGCPMKARMKDDIVSALSGLDAVRQVEVRFRTMTDEEKGEIREKVVGRHEPEEVPRIAERILAVSSGKGGVGKSTVTTNLARSLAAQGYKIGVLDADVYGFSIPRMLGITTQPTVIDNMIIPVEKEGIRIISMGFFVPDDTPVIWRGPLLHKTITQFMTDVVWDNPDILLIDLPPGTGDVTLTIAQKLPGAQLIVVTTPQPAAANVAARVAAMAAKTDLSLLGVIENMSYYVLPDGTREFIFGKDGGKLIARRTGAAFLGEIPLSKRVRECSDSGISLFEGDDATGAAEAYRQITRNLIGLF